MVRVMKAFFSYLIDKRKNWWGITIVYSVKCTRLQFADFFYHPRRIAWSREGYKEMSSICAEQ
jgi:hypothetical protein